MKINRKKLVSSHNPVHTRLCTAAPLTVGNGQLAFTADITGLQTLYQTYYHSEIPLCTMSQWGWHSTPVSEQKAAYPYEELALTSYDFGGRPVQYASEPQPGNEEVYHWLRHNPHRINLAQIGLVWEKEEPVPEAISAIRQELDLYSGILHSRFALHGVTCSVDTACDNAGDTLAFHLSSQALGNELGLVLQFPYGHYSISGSDWDSAACHTTTWEKTGDSSGLLVRSMDDTLYFVRITADCPFQIEETANHRFLLLPQHNECTLTVTFSEKQLPHEHKDIFSSSKAHWMNFWENGAAVSFEGSTDIRGKELERRVVLSQYLLAIQSSGALPPQETGLTCNSWYGKFHLEMHPWHAAWMPLWGQDKLLENSLPWYHEHLPEARWNAKKNGYQGARWPKMVAPDGIDAPSPIATLLIWQQPHILWLLELLYQNKQSDAFLQENWILVEETANFMADFAQYDEKEGCYNLLAPLIPVQEEFDPKKTNNPAFELEYWRLGLRVATLWATRLGKTPPSLWQKVAENMAAPAQKDGFYLSHRDAPDTFTHYTKDHPSMLGMLGMIPRQTADAAVIKNTLLKVLEVWDFDSLWGWDFALMAMTATLLDMPEQAIDILLKDTAKNQYVVSGNNFQQLRDDLPLYLPGNGSLLWAVAIMCTGYSNNTKPTPGFPTDGWRVTWEGLTAPPWIGACND